jgi:hypothetical protein
MFWPSSETMNAIRRFKATARPAGESRARVRRMGLRRALAMLETGERINDELHRWTVAPRRTLRPTSRGAA